LRKRCGFLNSRRPAFFTTCCTGFFTFPGQIGGFPTQHNSDDRPSKIIDLHELLGDWLYSQALPDNGHGRSAKYAGNINNSSFRGSLFFNMGCLWHDSSGTRGRFWPPLFCRCPRLVSGSRSLCHLRHRCFSAGGWTAAPFSRRSHHVPGLFFSLVHGIG
jgi:hypothetical protein